MSTVALPFVEKHNKTRRSAMIADQLREMIMEGHLKPGDRLPTEEQLCKHFGVSRTTLRESVQMLRVSGLLEVTPGRGSFVSAPDINKILKDLSLAGQYAGDVGFGDIKLMAALGAWVGTSFLPFGFVIASFAGLFIALTVPKGAPFPFGPALAAGLWIVGLAGPAFIDALARML